MRSKILYLSLTLLILSSLLSACTRATGVASSWPGLTANQGTAYLAYGQYLYAIDTANGSQKWHFPTEAEKGVEFYATPALTDDGQVIAGGFDHILYAIDAASGMLRWTFNGASDRYIAGPLVTENGIYAPSSDGNLYALDLNGNPTWVFSTGEAIWGTPTSNTQCNCIYVASMDRHVYALDATNGQQVWKSPELSGAIIGSPTFDAENKAIYVGTFGREMVALDAETGTLRWEVPSDEWIWSSPLLLDGVLYFGDELGTFYALNAADGTQVWKIQPLPESPIVSSPTTEAGIIYYATEASMVYGIATDGSVSYTQSIAADLYTSPIWSEGKLLVAEMQGDALLVALNENGVQQWVFAPEK